MQTFNAMTTLDNIDGNWEVEQQVTQDLRFPIQVIDNCEIEGQQTDKSAIMRGFGFEGEELEFLCINSKRYGIIPNKQVLDTVEGVLLDYDGLNSNSIKVNYHLKKQGTVMISEYFLEDDSFKLERETYQQGNHLEDWYIPRIRVINSYDGSNSLNLTIDTMRIICMNGQVSIQKPIDSIQAIHNENIDTVFNKEIVTDIMKRGLHTIRNARTLFNEMNELDIDFTKDEFLEKAQPIFDKRITGQEHEFQTNRTDKIWAYIQNERNGHNNRMPSMMDIYNGITEYITHGIKDKEGKTRKSNTVFSQDRRLQKARQFFKQVRAFNDMESLYN